MKTGIEIIKTAPDGGARLGKLTLPHGTVETPLFMPVGTNGMVKALPHEQMEEIGYKLILGNTYHLYLRPGTEIIGEAKGLHQFTGWKGNYLTDSGGYQLFSLAQFRKITEDCAKFQSHIDGSRHIFTPEKVVDIQTTLNSDIQMVLDYCTPPEIDFKEAKRALEITTRWAGRAKNRWLEKKEEGYEGLLFGIVQGNFFKELRTQSAKEIIDLDLPGIAIGGLSVGETPELYREHLFHTARYLPADKPRYVMGIGTVDYILEAVDAGIDMFDCVYPTRIARNGTVLTKRGNIALKNEKFKNDFSPIDPECHCPVCQRYSRALMRHLLKTGEIAGPVLASKHNLYFMYNFIEEIKAAIREDRFTEYKKNFMEKFYGRG